MQSSSDNFTLAVTGSNVLWAKTTVYADWGVDGYTTTKTSLATLHVRDLFDRTSTDSWGVADTGQTWTNTGGSNSDYDVTAGQGTVLHGTSNVGRYLVVGQNILDSDVTVEFSTSILAAGANHSYTVLLRYTDTSNHLRARVTFTTAQAVQLALITMVGGSETTLESVTTALTHVAGRRFTVRVQAGGTLFRAKVWDGTISEPAWQLSTTQSVIPGTGSVAMRTFVSSGGTVPLTFTIYGFRMVNGEVDDITDQIGQPLRVTHGLTQSLPAEVASFITGIGTTTGSVPLAYGREGVASGRYFSPFNTSSPVYPYPRDVPPVTVDTGLVTEGGIERIRIFTGQLANTPVRGRTASAEFISRTRMLLSKLLQPPGINGSLAGLNATWVVAWALHQCGIDVSPPPVDGCVYWAPMHGSTTQLIPDTRDRVNNGTTQYVKQTSSDEYTWLRHKWVTGPYLLAGFGEVTDEHTIRLSNAGVVLDPDGDDLLSDQNSVGRVEFWIRGDDANFNASPPGSGSVSRVAGMHAAGSTVEVRAGVDATRSVRVMVDDGTSTLTLTHSTALPTDGEWHFVGVAWSVSGNKLWVNLDGVVQTSTPGLSTAALPTTDSSDAIVFTWVSYIPVAELQITSGTNANPDTGADWMFDRAFTAGATVMPSNIELEALAEVEPIEAWQLIGRYAQSELAVMRTDEYDTFQYLTLGYWSKDAQQTVVDTISTRTNAQDLEVSLDPIQVRNVVRVGYTATTLQQQVVSQLTPEEPLNVVRPGIYTLTLEFSKPTVVATTEVGVVNEAFFGGFSGDVTISYITVNTAPDGTGTYLIFPDVICDIISSHPGGCVIQIDNTSSQVGYLANNVNRPPVQIYDYGVNQTSGFVVKSNDTSVAENDRGERGVAVDLRDIQRIQDATWVARHLASLLGRPIARVERASVFADPRRQPGDLVEVADAANTDADGQWRLISVEHNVDGARYSQTVNLVKAHPTGNWGDGSLWGRGTIWARSE